MSDLNVLNHPQNLLSIVNKLPVYLQNKWREHVGQMRQTQQKLIQFQDLMLFIASASDTANDPIYGRNAMASNSYQSSDYKSNPERQARGKPRATSFVTNTSSEPISTFNSKSKSCPLCHHQHDLDNCKTFLRKTIDERRNFLKENHLCSGCYGQNHISKRCVQKHVCEKCN